MILKPVVYGVLETANAFFTDNTILSEEKGTLDGIQEVDMMLQKSKTRNLNQVFINR